MKYDMQEVAQQLFQSGRRPGGRAIGVRPDCIGGGKGSASGLSEGRSFFGSLTFREGEILSVFFL